MENRHLFAFLTVTIFAFTPEGKPTSQRSSHANLSECVQQVSSIFTKVNDELLQRELEIEVEVTDHEYDATITLSDMESSFNKKNEEELKVALEKKNEKNGEKLVECVNQEQNRYYSDFGEGFKRCFLCFADHSHIANCEINWNKRKAKEKLNENSDKAKELDKICKDINSDSKEKCLESCKKLLKESENLASTSIQNGKEVVEKHKKKMSTCTRELEDSLERIDEVHEERLFECTG